MALGLASVIPAAAPVAAAGAAAPPCQLWVDAPYWESSDVLAAEGGRINCSSTRTVTLRIRQDRPWWPDRTLATSAPKTGTNVFLVVRAHCKGNSDMKVFAEVLTNTGGKMQSGRVLVNC